MRVIVVGNGLAGTIFSKTFRELNPEAEIDIFAREKYLYYPRPNLIEFLAGKIPQEKLFAFPADWYTSKKISVHLDRPVKKLYPESRHVELEDRKKEKYDALVLANGANSFVPPIAGAEKKGVFALRSLNDALDILEWIEDHPHVAIIGGGLLGLEIARAIHSRGGEVRVVEFFDRLLPRQLDPQGASVLHSQIENIGINVHLGVTTEEIRGQDEVQGLRLKGGEELNANTVIVAAGVKPDIGLAADAGLRTDKGVIVNDLLQTSAPGIYAAGDNVQHKDKTYGIIPASFNQARDAAFNVSGQLREHTGTVPSNTLKVVGLDVTSIGTVNPERGSFEEYRKEIKEKGIYKKLVVQNGRAVGAIWMGTKDNVNHMNRIILQQIDVGKWKEKLLEDDFDFSML
jgi:nitrite reductase (NADH) large subunit